MNGREKPRSVSGKRAPGYDRNVSTSKFLLNSIAYIHENPVRRKLCQRAIDWQWSSAWYYLGDPPKQQRSELPFIHGIPAGALD